MNQIPVSLMGESSDGEAYQLQDWGTDESSNSIVFFNSAGRKELIPVYYTLPLSLLLLSSTYLSLSLFLSFCVL